MHDYYSNFLQLKLAAEKLKLEVVITCKAELCPVYLRKERQSTLLEELAQQDLKVSHFVKQK